MSGDDEKELRDRMNLQYGPTICGKDLYTALGFKTYAAFNRVNKLNGIGVKIFKIDGRRGWFALTSEIAEWLTKQSKGTNIEEKKMSG